MRAHPGPVPAEHQGGGRPDLLDPVAVVEGGDQQQRAGLRAEVGEAARKGLLETLRERHEGDRVALEDARQRRARQLERCQGVAPRHLEDPPVLRRVEVRGGRGDERGGRSLGKRAEVQLRQADPVEGARGARAVRHHQGDRFRTEAAGHERERVARRPVEPMGVLRDDEQGARRGALGEQLQGGERDAIGVRCRRIGQAQRDEERVALMVRQVLPPAQDGVQELVEPGEGEVGLGLDAGRREHLEAAALHPLAQRPDERGLADARLPVDQQALAAQARALEQPVEHGRLRLSPKERGRGLPMR